MKIDEEVVVLESVHLQRPVNVERDRCIKAIIMYIIRRRSCLVSKISCFLRDRAFVGRRLQKLIIRHRDQDR
jgi:hypothetical protein